MNWLDIIVLIIFFFSFIGGFKEGAVRTFFSLITLLIAIPTAGRFYHLVATILSFLPGKDWENFVGFFIAMALISVILQLIFFLPRRIAQSVWGKGMLYRLLGGALNLLNTGIGFVVLVLVLKTYPIINWLVEIVSDSRVLSWLVTVLSFVPTMLPEIFRTGGTII